MPEEGELGLELGWDGGILMEATAGCGLPCLL